MTDKLKELALAAKAEDADQSWYSSDDLLTGVIDREADAAYIAAASPDAILAMIADLENERRKVTELVDGYEKDQAELKRLRTAIFTDNTQTLVNAEKRIAELEADVERLTLEKKAAAMNYEVVIDGLKAQLGEWQGLAGIQGDMIKTIASGAAQKETGRG